MLQNNSKALTHAPKKINISHHHFMHSWTCYTNSTDCNRRTITAAISPSSREKCHLIISYYLAPPETRWRMLLSPTDVLSSRNKKKNKTLGTVQKTFYWLKSEPQIFAKSKILPLSPLESVRYTRYTWPGWHSRNAYTI